MWPRTKSRDEVRPPAGGPKGPPPEGPQRAPGGRVYLPWVPQYTLNVRLTISVYPLEYLVPASIYCYAFS